MSDKKARLPDPAYPVLVLSNEWLGATCSVVLSAAAAGCAMWTAGIGWSTRWRWAPRELWEQVAPCGNPVVPTPT